MFLRRSEFYMTIRFSHAFLLISGWGSGGRSPPENFWGFSGYFSTFSYLWNYFLLFFRGVRGRSPRKFFELFQFSNAGEGLSRIFPDFFLTFWCLKKIEGGRVRRKFFPDVIFLRPLTVTSLQKEEILFFFFTDVENELYSKMFFNLLYNLLKTLLGCNKSI